MKFIVQCECGNEAILPVLDKKMLIVRDNLETQGFYLDTTKMHDKKMHVQCDKCKRWVTLSLS